MRSFVASMVFLLCFPGIASAGINHCKDRGTSVLVLSEKSKLYLCKDDKVINSYRVSLGSKGVGKTRKGDRKTPVGTYRLSSPRPSVSRFHMFIPVGYPTSSQRAQGYTGSAIGIHGPDQKYKKLGLLNTLVDWTAGCIAVGTNREIDNISNWVSENRANRIIIE